MIAEIVNCFELRVEDIKHLVKDLDDELMIEMPAPEMDHPAWIIGHLTFTIQETGKQVGMHPWLPKDWSQMFVKDANISSDPDTYPKKQKLMEEFESGEKHIITSLNKLKESQLVISANQKKSNKNFPTIFSRLSPTVGHLILNTLVGHFSIHVGQLSAWRRAMNLPKITEVC